MFKKTIIMALLVVCLAPLLLAEEAVEETYKNQLYYRHNKLELTTKTRVIGENRSYSSTDISSSTYSFEAFSQTYGNVATSSLQRSEQKEVTDWFIYKGGVEELSDLEFLELIGAKAKYEEVKARMETRGGWRTFGNVTIGAGIAAMLGGAAFSAGQSVISGGGIVTAIGFFVSAFNLEPHHYIRSGYALNKIDEYNLNFKKKLNLPPSFE